MHRFLIVIEKTPDGYSAYAPDLPGCAVAAPSIEEAQKDIHAALRMHVEGLEHDELPIPKTASLAEYVLI